MKFEKNDYVRLAKAGAPRSPLWRNCLRAYAVGGAICAYGELLNYLYIDVGGMTPPDGRTLTAITLVFLGVLLTGLGVFNDIAKFAGAGTLVPITGFANAVASPAMDSRPEGLVLGLGAKIFTVAGPVLLYGTLSGAVWGVIYYLWLVLA